MAEILTLSQTTNFRLFQPEKVCIRKTTESSPNVEKAIGKGVIACYKQYLLFQECIQKTCTKDMVKTRAFLGEG